MSKLIPLLILSIISFGCGQAERRDAATSNASAATVNSNTQRGTTAANNPTIPPNSSIENSSVVKANNKKRDVSYFQKIVFTDEKIGKTAQGEDGIVGKVKNIGNKTVKTLSIRAVFTDNNGRKISETDFPFVFEYSSDPNSNIPLKPNESRKFAFDVYDKSNLLHNFKLFVMEAETEE